MDVIIYTGRIGRYLEGRHVGRLRRRIIRIQEHWGVLTDIRKEFGRKDDKSAKVTELRRLEQESKIMERFI